MRSIGETAVDGEDQESGIELKGDRVWMDITVSTREMRVEKEDQRSGRRYHGWLDSTVGTGETVVKENQHGRGDHGSRRGIMARRTTQLTSKKMTVYKVMILHLPFLRSIRTIKTHGVEK